MRANLTIIGKCLAGVDPKPGNGQRAKWTTRALGVGGAVALLALIWGGPSVHAAMLVRQMDLTALSKHADAIVRATVVDIEAGSVRAGGGNIPTITYHLRVKETVAGQARGVFTLTMVGELKPPATVGKIKRVPAFSDMPALKQGQEYLLFTTQPSRAGLSTTVGLGQGCFTVYAQDKKEFAVNTANNAGLGSGPAGPVEYGRLVQQIRALRTSQKAVITQEGAAKGAILQKGALTR